MTNEEFTGHLLASFHGPKREEIVAAIFSIAVGNADVFAPMILKACDLDTVHSHLLALTMLAVADNEANKTSGTVADIVQRTKDRAIAAKVLREYAKSAYAHMTLESEAPAVREMVHRVLLSKT